MAISCRRSSSARLKRIELMGVYSEIERLWSEEAKRRLDGYRRGDIEAVSGDEVMRRARLSTLEFGETAA